MGLLWFLIVGLIAGWLAGKIMKGSGYGVAGDLIIGIIGAFIGGEVFGMLGIVAFSLIGSIISATVGAILLILLIRALKRV